MGELTAGDIVLNAKNGSPASTRGIVNQHRSIEQTARLVTIHLAGGGHISLTADHVLSLDGAWLPARNARAGAALVGAHGEAVVLNSFPSDSALALSAQLALALVLTRSFVLQMTPVFQVLESGLAASCPRLSALAPWPAQRALWSVNRSCEYVRTITASRAALLGAQQHPGSTFSD